MAPFIKLPRQVISLLSSGGRSASKAPHPAEVSSPGDRPATRHEVAFGIPHEAAIRELLALSARSLVTPGKHARANMMLFSPDLARRRVHTATAYNMEKDPDRDLEIGADAGASGRAVSDRRATVADLVLLQITATPAFGLTSAEQACVRRTLKSLVSVPIFNPEDIDGPLLGSLQVDSDLTVEEAGFNRPESAELLQQFGDVLALLLIGVPVRIGGGTAHHIKTALQSRVGNASQVEPGLYVANRSTSIFSCLQNRWA
jgi:hypothetical protein